MDKRTCSKPSRTASQWAFRRIANLLTSSSYPSWTMKIQTMTQKQAEEVWMEKRINVFDLTHIWPHKEFPLRDVCKLTLNENVKVCRLPIETILDRS